MASEKLTYKEDIEGRNEREKKWLNEYILSLFTFQLKKKIAS